KVISRSNKGTKSAFADSFLPSPSQGEGPGGRSVVAAGRLCAFVAANLFARNLKRKDIGAD
ncbi:MAG TPA: hypothetical protein VFB38_04720, partial [Chthonomonadaceae bacterium]|nr:hypothetical protein [Chthonomonadaceae bacterium]